MFSTNYIFMTDNTHSDADAFHFLCLLLFYLFFLMLPIYHRSYLSAPLPSQISFCSPPQLSIYSPFVFPLCLKPSDLGPSFSQSPVFLSHLSLISRLLLPICFSLPFFYVSLPLVLISAALCLPATFSAPISISLSVTASLAFSNQAG